MEGTVERTEEDELENKLDKLRQEMSGRLRVSEIADSEEESNTRNLLRETYEGAEDEEEGDSDDGVGVVEGIDKEVLYWDGKYTGKFVGKVRQGYGVMEYFTGEKYEGVSDS
jgi:hypothetical protein